MLTRRNRRAAACLTAALLIPLTLTACTTESHARARTCLTGTLAYDHRDAEAGPAKPLVTRPARNANWELWGRTSGHSDAPGRKLATGITDSGSGRFRACAKEPGTLREAHVRFRSGSTDLWRVVRSRTSQQEYAFDSPSRRDVSADQSLGTVKVPAAMSNAWHITDTLNLLYWKRDNPTSACWTRRQVTGRCDQLTFVWTRREAAEGAGYFDLGGTNRVIAAGDMTDSEHFVLHEAGHWFQWQLYGRDLPDATNCDPHYIEKRSSGTCAWTEGFADATAAYVLGDHRYVDETGAETSLENDATTPGWDPGDEVQGRVGGSLLDLWAKDGPDGGSWNRTLRLMASEPSADFREYFTVDRPKASPPLSTTGSAEAIVGRHTISTR
ncbi:metalloprotease [Streptomyces sp. NBC_01381]|uniref:metalloprotease n=1 Tax=Streptomyces sp. NBC_01381 TaxID=2903845 RepID=UPI00225605E4|nr:metalloprotease [Streptomyces sp. NBC_01381]MCX4670142.1 metalloprotease [Streptomyces sp. NBC_01381]